MKRRLADIHRTPANPPLGYFITVRSYGTWLHGDKRGSVDRRHNVRGTPLAPPDAGRESEMAGRMKHAPVVFDGAAAELLEETVGELCTHRGWHLFAVSARSNHLHAVVCAGVTAERVLADIKARTTRLLRENGFIGSAERPWVHHGSTPHLWTPEQLSGAIDYVRNRQGEALKRRGGPEA